MAGIADDLNSIKGDVGDLRGNNQVARFAYTQDAYTNDEAAGRASFDIDENNNIPTKDAASLNTNPTVLDRGFQTQASSITRQLQNHFYGRVSYNLNKIVDRVWQALGTLSAAMGRSDSAAGDVTRIATLDTNGRLPSNQLTEDVMEIKAYWDASTNSPDLTSVANRKPGNVYYVSTEGTCDIGGGSRTYYVGDVLICNKSLQWERIPVTYVKGGAESASAYRTGKADITKANVGLGNVADINQSPAIKDISFTASASAVTVGGTKLDGNAASLTGASFPMASSLQAGLMSASDYDLLHNMVLNSTYPVGTVYWTSNGSFDPNVGFGGTWVRIKDTFVYAAGDNDTVNATGGEKTHTLITSEMPSHTHSFTGVTVMSDSSSSSYTGGENHDHTHGFTPAGSVSGSCTIPSGTYTTGWQSADHVHSGASLSFSGSPIQLTADAGVSSELIGATWEALGSARGPFGSDEFWQWGHWKFTPAGSISGSTGTNSVGHYHSILEMSGSISASFSGSYGTTGGVSAYHSHYMSHTHEVTASGTNSNAGGDGAHNNMPPYIVKYCWERTA